MAEKTQSVAQQVVARARQQALLKDAARVLTGIRKTALLKGAARVLTGIKKKAGFGGLIGGLAGRVLGGGSSVRSGPIPAVGGSAGGAMGNTVRGGVRGAVGALPMVGGAARGAMGKPSVRSGPIPAVGGVSQQQPQQPKWDPHQKAMFGRMGVQPGGQPQQPQQGLAKAGAAAIIAIKSGNAMQKQAAIGQFLSQLGGKGAGGIGKLLTMLAGKLPGKALPGMLSPGKAPGLLSRLGAGVGAGAKRGGKAMSALAERLAAKPTLPGMLSPGAGRAARPAAKLPGFLAGGGGQEAAAFQGT